MRKRMTICKISNASLALLILALPVSATENGKPAELRDHEYYSRELQKLEDSTRRIHEEVDRILKEFRQNMEEYRKHTRGATAIPVEKEEASAKLKGQDVFLNGRGYEVRTSVIDQDVYGTLDFSQKQRDQVEISNFKLSYDPFPKLKPKNIEGFKSFQESFKEQYPPSGHSSPTEANYFEKYAAYQVSRFVTSALPSMKLALKEFKSSKTYILPAVKWDSGDDLNEMFVKLDVSDVLELYVEYPYTVELLNDLKSIRDPNRRSRAAKYMKKFDVKEPLFWKGDVAKSGTAEEKKSGNLKGQAHFLNGGYELRVGGTHTYGKLKFSQKKPDEIEISNLELDGNPFPDFPKVDNISYKDVNSFTQRLKEKYSGDEHAYLYSNEYGYYQLSQFVNLVMPKSTFLLGLSPEGESEIPQYLKVIKWNSGNGLSNMSIRLMIEPNGTYELNVIYPYSLGSQEISISPLQKFIVKKSFQKEPNPPFLEDK